MRHTAAGTCGRLLLAFGLLCVVPRQAVAQAPQGDPSASQPSPGPGFAYERGGLMGAGLVAGIKLGAAFSQPFSALGSSFTTEVELGVTLPVLERALEIYLAGAYLEPEASGPSLDDPRVPSDVRYRLVQQETALTLALRYRLPVPSRVRPYAACGPRYYFLRTLLQGEARASAALGASDDDAGALGVFGALGAELHIGLGAIVAEAHVAWAKLNTLLLPNSNVGVLGVTLGYRLFL